MKIQSPTRMLRTESLVVRLDLSAVRVLVSAGGKESSIILKRGEEAIIGSGPEAQLSIDDPTVSRAHVKLVAGAGDVRITDLGSTNGTFYEGAQIKDATLTVGATLQIGHASMRLLPTEAEVRASEGLSHFGGLVGDDVRMKEMFALLRDVAPSDATVILEGETGTGKELVAHAIHEASRRNKGPFVVFDCTAVPKDLIESALFGHVKGAFTGATSARIGAFKKASGGTIFLDELGELPLELQPKLLRVLESRTVQPVGGDDPEKVDVRVVCATNRNLKTEVKNGRFREDLYFRLAVVKVSLPPLRDRPDDIVALARHFVKESKRDATLDVEGLIRLREHPFPGNVRELRNLVERALSLSQTRGPVDLSVYAQPTDDRMTAPIRPLMPQSGSFDIVSVAVREALDEKVSFKDAKALVVDAFERQFLKGLVEACGGNLSKAAQKAQMDRKHLRELLRRHGMRDPEE